MLKANVSKSIRIGLLAYGAIGHEHNLAVQATSGLELTAVCDTNPDRIVAAKELAPDVASFSDAVTMLDSGTLDLVVISTPPNSHYAWAKEALQRNSHVVLGGGRTNPGAPVDWRVGVDQLISVGDKVDSSTVIAQIHSASEDAADIAEQRIRAAIVIGEARLEPRSVLIS